MAVIAEPWSIPEPTVVAVKSEIAVYSGVAVQSVYSQTVLAVVAMPSNIAEPTAVTARSEIAVRSEVAELPSPESSLKSDLEGECNGFHPLFQILITLYTVKPLGELPAASQQFGGSIRSTEGLPHISKCGDDNDDDNNSNANNDSDVTTAMMTIIMMTW